MQVAILEARLRNNRGAALALTEETSTLIKKASTVTDMWETLGAAQMAAWTNLQQNMDQILYDEGFGKLSDLLFLTSSCCGYTLPHT